MLKKRARGAKTAHRGTGCGPQIAADLQVTVGTVRKWRGRSATRGLVVCRG
jgi:transposase